jgi:hypothetical protein
MQAWFEWTERHPILWAVVACAAGALVFKVAGWWGVVALLLLLVLLVISLTLMEAAACYLCVTSEG